MVEALRVTMEETEMMTLTESRSGGETEGPTGAKQSYGAGGKYRAGRTDTEESAAESA